MIILMLASYVFSRLHRDGLTPSLRETVCESPAKQKFRPTRRSGFSGAKAYMLYVEVLKKHCNNVGRTFCDAIMVTRDDNQGP